MKFIGFYSILLALLFIQACEKDDVDLNPDLRTVIAICDILATDNESKVSIYSIYLDEGNVNVSESIVAAGDGSYFIMDGDGVDFSFSVREWGLGTPKVSNTQSYSGKLYEDAFVKDQVNRLDLIRDGNDWKLLLNGSDQIIPGSTPTPETPYGVWQRYGSPKNYQTDLAIGGITGEASNRVFMCEHPGSPSAGLYKGYINGNTITWDAVHQLPDADFNILDGTDDRTLYFGVGDPSQAGKYKKGTWTNTCGPI